jgi:hypothetical protein
MPPAIFAKGGALWRGHCGIARTASAAIFLILEQRDEYASSHGL